MDRPRPKGGIDVRTRTKRLALAVGASAVLLAGATAPSLVFGADHLDAPGLTPPSGRLEADINDVYVFDGASGRTAVAVTTGPLAGVLAPTSYGSDVLYEVKVDRNGDAIEDLAYKVTFSGVRGDGSQRVVVKRATGSQARGHTAGGVPVAKGSTERTLTVAGGGSFFAGLRADPFFFDLDAFLGTIGTPNGRSFNDGNENDFFEVRNTLAMVLEVPDAALGGNIAVWATTSVRQPNGSFVQVDRMGRPAINTVFNTTALGGDTADKNAFNAGSPSGDSAFADNVENVLRTLSSLDMEGPYTEDQIDILRGILLPDVLRYDTSHVAVGPLDGRNTQDDVIDVELNLVTGGFPFPGRDGTGAIPGDGVSAHPNLVTAFPYLEAPH
jgi:hypothetical protein